MPTEFDERRAHLLQRQQELEMAMQGLAVSGDDRRSAEWSKVEAEYIDVVDELECMDTGKWKPRE